MAIGGIKSAEKVLGFPLPDLLGRIYMDIGNGGFGPGYRFIPLRVKAVGRRFDGSMAAIYKSFMAGARESHQWMWPKGMLPFCDWGENIHTCIDCLKEPYPVYRSATELLLEGGPGGLRMERPSLYDWLTDMVEGKIEFYYGHLPHYGICGDDAFPPVAGACDYSRGRA